MGAGGHEIGQLLAKPLGATYVHHAALRRIARDLKATVHAVAQKEMSFGNSWARVAAFVELAFDRMSWHAMHPAAVPAQVWAHAERSRLRELAGEITDSEYIRAAFSTAMDMAKHGSLVLVKRAGILTLRDLPDAVHVGLFADREHRIVRMSQRLGTGLVEAEEVVLELERARRAWFAKLGGADPEDLRMYHLVIHTDMGETPGQVAARAIAEIYDLVPHGVAGPAQA